MKQSLQCLLFGLLAVAADARTWKEAGSDRAIVGEYVRTEGENVVITRSTGITAKIPLSRLSEDDQKFAVEQAAAKAAPVGVFKWETDFEVAKKRAKDEKKPMLLDFTGSDWCGWCIRLKKEVFSTPEFEKYAKDNLVLVEVDFPRTKKLPKKEAEQNAKLQQEYKIQGYPSIILLNSDGKRVANTGYLAGGAEKYIEHLKGLLK
ncbi:MAG: thioredoxin family protein [Verrucomicrobiota bacterium]